MDKEELKLLKQLKKICIYENANLEDEQFSTINDVDQKELDKLLAKNGVRRMDIIIECIDSKEVLKRLDTLTEISIKDAYAYYGIELSTDEVDYLLRHYLLS